MSRVKVIGARLLIIFILTHGHRKKTFLFRLWMHLTSCLTKSLC